MVCQLIFYRRKEAKIQSQNCTKTAVLPPNTVPLSVKAVNNRTPSIYFQIYLNCQYSKSLFINVILLFTSIHNMELNEVISVCLYVCKCRAKSKLMKRTSDPCWKLGWKNTQKLKLEFVVLVGACNLVTQ